MQGFDTGRACLRELRRCDGSTAKRCTDSEYICSGCAQRIPNTDPRHPAAPKARKRTKPRRSGRGVIGASLRTSLNAPPLGIHSLARPFPVRSR